MWLQRKAPGGTVSFAVDRRRRRVVRSLPTLLSAVARTADSVRYGQRPGMGSWSRPPRAQLATSARCRARNLRSAKLPLNSMARS